jgi:hypothetical protein
VNENIKHLRQIIENSIPAETTSGQPSLTLAEAQVCLDLLEADFREAREREKPEVRGLLHTVVKWINAGHMIPNDDGAMSLHADQKRATAAKMGMRLVQGTWLHAANKAVEPHENTATPMLDPALSNLAAALTWLYGNVSRVVCISHGGPGGKWYVRLEDEDGESPSDAANDDIATAIGDAMCGVEAKP